MIEKYKLTFNYAVAILCISLLSACDTKPKFAELCNEHPKICNEFAEDSWCKVQRISVGMNNYYHSIEPSELNQYKRLISYEKYAKCMEYASKIEHIKLKHKKTMRTNNMLLAKEKIRFISQETEQSEHPYLLYYHWSRYINTDALNKLLAMEGSSALETTESQFNLATYYIKRDIDKTLTLLFHALELYKVDDGELNVEIFKTLSSIFADKENAKQTYIWLKIAKLSEPSDESIKPNTLKSYIDGYQLNEELLNQVAEVTLNNILTGEFKAPKF